MLDLGLSGLTPENRLSFGGALAASRMNDRLKQEDEIFETARRFSDAGQRRLYVDEVCAGNPPLKARIETLLSAYFDADSFFQHSGSAVNQSVFLFPVAEGPGARIGRYRLLEKIGEGGCGVVYMAEQEFPVRRKVALKIIKLGMDTKQVVARFEAERQALAMMDHPSIAKVFDGGSTDTGRPFFAMELVRGATITYYCDQQRLATRERLELFLQICNAVQHAHQKGIIHRDLKPSNVLVTVNDGVAIPKVIDFGIAKAIEGRLTEHTFFTGFDQFLGTPAYTSPEQATLTSVDIDTRSDLYSLGVLLYELLTGRTPFDTKELLALGMDRMRQTILEVDPLSPSARLRSLPAGDLRTTAGDRCSEAPALLESLRGDLDAIVMKCLEKDRAQRYQSALDLSADLQRHLKHEPVLAAAPDHIDRVRKWIRRNRAAFVVTAVLIMGGLISTSAVLYQARKGRRLATNSLVRLHVSNGARSMNEGDFFGSLVSFTEALRLDAGNAKREEPHRIRIGSVLQQCPKLLGVFGHEDRLNGAVFSPDDRRILTGSEDGIARVCDLSSGKVLWQFGHAGPVYGMAYSPDNQWVLTVSRTPHLWKADTFEPVSRPEIRNFLKSNNPQPCFSPDSAKLLTLVEPKIAQTWNIPTGAPVGEPLRHDQEILFFYFSPDSRLVMTLTGDRVARIWEADSGKLQCTLDHNTTVQDACFSPNSQEVVILGESATLWDLRTGSLKERFHANPAVIQSGCYDSSGQRLLTKSSHRSIHLWDAVTTAPLIPPIVHALPVYAACFSPDGRRIATSSFGNTLQIWDTQDGKLLPPVFRHTWWRDPVAFSSDGRMIAVIQREIVQVWGFQEQGAAPFAIRPVSFFTQTAVSADRRYKARIGGDNVLRTWEVASNEPLGPPISDSVPFKQAGFGVENDIVVTESGDGRARVWDAKTAQPLTRLLETRYDSDAPRVTRQNLARDSRSVQDLVMMANLLSGNRIDKSGSIQRLESHEFIELWTYLRQKYPEAFTTTPKEVAAWHQTEAAASEKEWDWRVALFHLSRLISAVPENEVFRHRRAYAQLALTHASELAVSQADRRRVTPLRDPLASRESIDLSNFYNRSLRSIHQALPSGILKISGSFFDLRGVVQLSGQAAKRRGADYPEKVSGIPVRRKCQRLRFIHATEAGVQNGTEIGNYVINYQSGETTIVRIIYGVDLRDYWTSADEPQNASDSEIFWIGPNGQRSLRAFISTRQNPQPDEEVASIDFVSNMTEAGPFLLAITAE